MTAPRTIALLTTGRQDWGILRSTAAALAAEPSLRLRVLAGGMHLSAAHGRTIDEVHADVDPSAEVVELRWVDGADAATQAARALDAVGRALADDHADALVLVGDRFETLAAALAATVARVPIVHLHGGEQTLGAFDDAIRHAITKLAHLHLVSHEEHGRRVVAMGEDPATVHVAGAPGLDAAFRDDLPDRAALEADLGIALVAPVVVVTVQPTTLAADPAAAARAVASALDEVPATYVVTLPNVDPGHEAVRDALERAAVADPRRRVAVEALGGRRYWALLRLADAMLGNSSSGILEAPAIGLPVVNVGERQAGRRRDGIVLDVVEQPAAIADALRTALEAATHERARAAIPGTADGRAGQRIASIIAAWRPPDPPRKAPIPIPA
jgi:UDP-hydrolysing UDP-N-acetyl-D-glucosamine 2-epimerase